MEHETLLANKEKARKLRTQIARYNLVVSELYKRGFSSPLLKCLDQDQANYVLRELHDGVCSLHFGEKTMITKSFEGWILLANSKDKLLKFCEEMPPMTKT